MGKRKKTGCEHTTLVIDKTGAYCSNPKCGQIILDVRQMRSAVVWIDPTTGVKRYTAAHDYMYSTAVMFAVAYLDENGNEVPIMSSTTN